MQYTYKLSSVFHIMCFDASTGMLALEQNVVLRFGLIALNRLHALVYMELIMQSACQSSRLPPLLTPKANAFTRYNICGISHSTVRSKNWLTSERWVSCLEDFFCAALLHLIHLTKTQVVLPNSIRKWNPIVSFLPTIFC